MGFTESIRVADLSFGYHRGAHVLGKFNLTIPKGKMVALVGESGIGKSTVAELVLCLRDPASGAVLVDDRDIRKFSVASWRARIGYVSQNSFLFNMSIIENVGLSKPDAT